MYSHGLAESLRRMDEGSDTLHILDLAGLGKVVMRLLPTSDRHIPCLLPLTLGMECVYAGGRHLLEVSPVSSHSATFLQPKDSVGV